MTLAMALHGSNGTVVATDSRVSMKAGDIECHSDTGKKITLLGDSMVLVTLGSATGFTDFLTLYFKEKILTQEEMKEKADDLLHVAQYLSAFLKQDIDLYEKDQLVQAYFGFEFILVGYYQHQAKVLGMDTLSAPTLVPQIRNKHLPYYVGGITDVATYYLREFTSIMREGLPSDALAKIATFLVQEASKSDDRVGGPAQIAILRDGQPVQMLKPDELENLSRSVVGISGENLLCQIVEGKGASST